MLNASLNVVFTERLRSAMMIQVAGNTWLNGTSYNAPNVTSPSNEMECSSSKARCHGYIQKMMYFYSNIGGWIMLAIIVIGISLFILSYLHGRVLHRRIVRHATRLKGVSNTMVLSPRDQLWNKKRCYRNGNNQNGNAHTLNMLSSKCLILSDPY